MEAPPSYDPGAVDRPLWCGFLNSAKPPPPGTHAVSQIARPSESEVDFRRLSPRGSPVAELAAIDHAEQLIVLDRSPVSRELAQHRWTGNTRGPISRSCW
jgi:hypothetical protein